jgi:LuxR family quorum-sensing transcriptional regulator LasR
MDLDVIEALSSLAHSNRERWQATLHEQLQRLGVAHFRLRLSSGAHAVDIASFAADAPEQEHGARDQAAWSILPVTWARSTPEVERTLHGMTFALLGPQGQSGTLDIFSGSHDEKQAVASFRANLPMLSLLKDCALQGALGLLQAQGTIKLTKRETEVLRWSAIGKTNWEISNICNRSEACIDFHFKNIRRKFGVSTRSAAAVQALAMQLIQI